MIGRDSKGRIVFMSNVSGEKCRRLQCNRAFAEMLAASVERKEFERDWGEMRFREPRQPRLHQKGVDSAFIVAVFLAAVALILCCVR